ncbi:hypothetical protein [Streptomyces sp. CT34]|uniref:hypothetical protein n=1 Tax=Streptomyces sp. CT34 TaxID=1553907 RepID=UPI000AF5F1F2|nr:hypothetical protein [Streptomyces sp. CT34]
MSRRRVPRLIAFTVDLWCALRVCWCALRVFGSVVISRQFENCLLQSRIAA